MTPRPTVSVVRRYALRGEEESSHIRYGRYSYLFGIGIGVGIGLADCTHKGKKLRADIADRVSDISDKVRERANGRCYGMTASEGVESA